MLRSTTLTVALVATLAAEVAHADPASDAKDLFARGRELRAHEDCRGAVPLFRKAYAVYPDGLGSLRNAAECDELLGRFASARRAWLDLKRALLTHQDPKYEGWTQDADQAAARLEPKLATLTVDLKGIGAQGQPAPAGPVRVTLDDELLAPSLIGTALDRNPGRHLVRVTGEGVATQERAIDLVAGDAKHVAFTVRIQPVSDDTPAAVSTTSTPDETREQPGGTRRTVSWVLIGVGAASLVGAGVSLAVRQSALGDLNDACPSHLGCSPSVQETVSRGQTASTLVTALGVTGAFATTAGIVLLATGPSSGPRTGLRVTPTIGGALAAWSF